MIPSARQRPRLTDPAAPTGPGFATGQPVRLNEAARARLMDYGARGIVASLEVGRVQSVTSDRTLARVHWETCDAWNRCDDLEAAP